ncbi:alpha/beta hydrolase [Cochlodiniinecator piscidefendens]|uniref:alpha/beta hydrolase n=1 Tax=Cochlodiniinecator piscidefendens TaxID=2715756 RepID=UPI00140C1C05|nr:alpha/beta hydrolase [Cochlodiniinecator piscidefendens]
MTLLKVNTNGTHLIWPTETGPIETPTHYRARKCEPLEQALHHTSDEGPIVILLHGMKFSPSDPSNSPHKHILALSPDPMFSRAISWPRHLGFGKKRPETGLCIAFGWEACKGFRAAYREAAMAGRQLAQLIELIKSSAPNRKIQVFAHSMGARVFLAALPHLPANAVERAILMAAAELSNVAEQVMKTPAGRTVEIFNITSRENDWYDFLVEWASAPFTMGARSLGHGLKKPCGNWLDIQLDCPRTLRRLARVGFRISPPAHLVCHWSGYLRPGMFGFYQALLRHPQKHSLDQIRALLPCAKMPRWSRLIAYACTCLRLPSQYKA